LTASYAGFVNGDTLASLAKLPILTTPASVASGVGMYAITASGAVDADYTISYVPGTLTITPAPLTLAAGDQGLSTSSLLAAPALLAAPTPLVRSPDTTSEPTPTSTSIPVAGAVDAENVGATGPSAAIVVAAISDSPAGPAASSTISTVTVVPAGSFASGPGEYLLCLRYHDRQAVGATLATAGTGNLQPVRSTIADLVLLEWGRTVAKTINVVQDTADYGSSIDPTLAVDEQLLRWGIAAPPLPAAIPPAVDRIDLSTMAEQALESITGSDGLDAGLGLSLGARDGPGS
jgi:hypothetical protein